jgi:hypothetical protein
MTQIETIIAEIERRYNQNNDKLTKIPEYCDEASILRMVCAEDLYFIDFINSLPAEQPSEELEKAAIEFGAKQGLELKPFARRFFIAGAKWQKEQMMKGFCYETKVYRDEEGDGIDTPIESWLALENNEITNLPNIGLKDGDKVKVIIVKEDEQ